MNTDFDELDPNRIAAILYRPDDDVDMLLAGFACDLAHNGTRIGGIVQRNLKDATGRKIGLHMGRRHIHDDPSRQNIARTELHLYSPF